MNRLRFFKNSLFLSSIFRSSYFGRRAHLIFWRDFHSLSLAFWQLGGFTLVASKVRKRHKEVHFFVLMNPMREVYNRVQFTFMHDLVDVLWICIYTLGALYFLLGSNPRYYLFTFSYERVLF